MISDASSEAFGAHVYIVLVSVLFVDINFVASCQPVVKGAGSRPRTNFCLVARDLYLRNYF